MHLLTLMLLLAGGDTDQLDPLSQAVPEGSRAEVHDLLQAIAQQRAQLKSIAYDPDLADDVVLSRAAKWIHVDEAELDRELAEAADLAKRPRRSETLLLIAEQTQEMASPYAWWLPKSDGGGQPLETFSDAFANKLQRMGWELVEQSTVTNLKAARHLSAAPSDAEALELCNQSGGGAVLVGRVTATSPGPSELSGGMMAASAHVQAHLLDCHNQKTLGRFDQSIGDLTTFDNALQGAETKALRLAGTQEASAVRAKLRQALITFPR